MERQRLLLGKGRWETLKNLITNIHLNQRLIEAKEDNMEKITYENKMEQFDSVVNNIVNRIKDRAVMGKTKYGTDLDRKDLSTEDWLDHAIEEALDFSLYLTKLKENLKKSI